MVTDFESHPITVRHALVNMAFNLGRTGLSKFVNTLGMVNRHQYAQAADNALKSLWASQVGPRAERIAQQLRLADADLQIA